MKVFVRREILLARFWIRFISFLEIRFTGNEGMCKRLKLWLRENLRSSFRVEAEHWQFNNLRKLLRICSHFLFLLLTRVSFQIYLFPKPATWNHFVVWRKPDVLVVPKYEKFGFPGPNIFRKYLHWLLTIHKWRVTFSLSSFSVLLNFVNNTAKGQNGSNKKKQNAKFSVKQIFLTCAYQEVKNVCFWTIWRTLCSCYLRFEISTFVLLPTICAF